MVAEDWARFDFYAHRIRTLKLDEASYYCSLDQSAIDEIRVWRKDSPWLPRLQSLWLIPIPKQNPLQAALPFLDSRIKDLRIDGTKLLSTHVSHVGQFFQLLEKTNQPLRHFQFTAPWTGLDPTWNPALMKLLPVIKKAPLEHFGYNNVAPEVISKALLNIPTLQMLSIDMQNSTLALHAFTRLHNIKSIVAVLNEFDDLASFPIRLQGSAPKCLTFSVIGGYTQSRLGKFFTDLQGNSDLSRLESFQIWIDSEASGYGRYTLDLSRISSGDRNVIVPQPALIDTLVSMLSQCKSLQTFYLALPSKEDLGFGRRFWQQVAKKCPGLSLNKWSFVEEGPGRCRLSYLLEVDEHDEL